MQKILPQKNLKRRKVESNVIDYNLLIQYSIVGVILLGICVWIIWKISKKNKKNSNPCCGCGLAESCNKIKNKNLKNNGNNKDS